MKPLKEYFEYRDFLRDYFAEKKKENACYSLRYIARRVGVDPSHLIKIFQRHRHIGNSLIDVFITYCDLKGSDAEYFANLVRFNKSKTDREGKIYFEKCISLKGAGAKSLEKNQYEFYTKWYYSAILTLLEFYQCTDDYAMLASKLSPPISESKAKKAVVLLKRLGLIERNEQGVWKLTHKIITTGNHCRSLAVRNFQETTMNLAIESLDRHPPEKRDISTVTVTIAECNINKINECIAQFRENMLQLARDEAVPDKVYQLNIQFFPLTQ